MISTIYKMNANHLDCCLCLGCLKVGDTVEAFVEDDGFSEEIITEVVQISDDYEQIGVEWPGFNDGDGTDCWFISTDPNHLNCSSYGKIIRKITNKV